MKATTIVKASFLLAAVIAMVSLTSIPNEEKFNSPMDTLQIDREKHINSILATIKGKESKPADSVFKNIQSMKGVPAGRLLRIMDVAYSQSLGVSCGHCHNTAKWDSDEKKTKQITRDMGKMVRRINMELLFITINTFLYGQSPLSFCPNQMLSIIVKLLKTK